MTPRAKLLGQYWTGTTVAWQSQWLSTDWGICASRSAVTLVGSRQALSPPATIRGSLTHHVPTGYGKVGFPLAMDGDKRQ